LAQHSIDQRLVACPKLQHAIFQAFTYCFSLSAWSLNSQPAELLLHIVHYQ